MPSQHIVNYTLFESNTTVLVKSGWYRNVLRT